MPLLKWYIAMFPHIFRRGRDAARPRDLAVHVVMTWLWWVPLGMWLNAQVMAWLQ